MGDLYKPGCGDRTHSGIDFEFRIANCEFRRPSRSSPIPSIRNSKFAIRNSFVNRPLPGRATATAQFVTLLTSLYPLSVGKLTSLRPSNTLVNADVGKLHETAFASILT